MIFILLISFIFSSSVNALYKDMLHPAAEPKVDELNREIGHSLLHQEHLVKKFEIICDSKFNDDINKQAVNDIKKLLNEGLKPNAKAKNGQPLISLLLDSTIEHNQLINILSLLIKNGASVNAENNEGDSPLLQVCNKDYPMQWYQTEVARVLIEKKADINFQAKNGNTPLHGAVSSSNVGLFKLLWAEKPELKLNTNGKDARLLAISLGQIDMLHIMDGTYRPIENNDSN